MSTGERAGYRPWLDGFRAVAVLLVLVHHGGVGELTPGLGGLGVSLFFALSGYLITGLLLDEHARVGRIALGWFYARRAARLLPALALVVVVCDAVFLLAGEVGPVLASVAAMLYATNFVAIDLGQHLHGFGHTWSLAVEEHFYLTWPPILIALLHRADRRRILHVTLAACVVVILWRWLLVARGAEPIHLYVGSLERADALLYGCAAAMGVRLGWRPGVWILLAAPFVIAGYLAGASPESAGSWVLYSTVLGVAGAGMVAAVDQSRLKWLRGVLSWRPLVAVGVRSYGLYLWHAPLILIIYLLGGRDQLAMVTAMAGTFIAAWLSYRWLEKPCRDWVRQRESSARSHVGVRPDAEAVLLGRVREDA